MMPACLPRTALSRAAWLGGLALVYFAGASLGLLFTVPGTNATAVWIPTGVAVAATLRLGRAVWPAVFLGALAANLLLLGRLGLGAAGCAGIALAAAVGNTAEAVLAGQLVERSTGTWQPFHRVRHVLAYLVGGAVLPTALSALIGTSAFCAFTGRWELFRTMGVAWWVGDLVGALVVAPLLLGDWREPGRPRNAAVHRDAALAALLAAALWFGLCPLLPPTVFLFFPLLVLGSFRLGPFYSSALVALLAVLATFDTWAGTGPFAGAGPLQVSLVLQQGFVGSLAVTTLVLGSALHERRGLVARMLLRGQVLHAQSELKLALVGAADRAALLREACRLLVERGGFRTAWVGVPDPSTGRLRHLAAAGFPPGEAEQLRLCPGEPDLPETLGVIDSGAVDPGRLAAARAEGRSLRWTCPLHPGDPAAGTLLASHADPEALGPEEIAQLQSFAGDLGYALETLEARTQLRRAEQLRAEILGRVSDGFVALDKDWNYLFLNEQAAALFGRRPEDLVGKHIWTEFPEGIGQPFHQNYEKAMREQVPVFFEDHYAPWDRWFENRVYPSPEGLSIFFHEITERRRAEARLQESEQRLASIYQTVTDPIFLLAVEPEERYRFLSVNPAFLHVTGLREEQVVGRWVNDIIPEPSRSVVLDGYRRAITTRTVVSWVEASDYPTGRLVGEVRIAPVLDGQGCCTHLVGTVNDLTESKRTEAALTAKAAELAALNALGIRLADSLEPGACARAALGSLLTTVAPDLALFFLREGEALRLLYAESGGVGPHPASPEVQRLARGQCGECARDGRPRYVARLAAEEAAGGLVSFASLPLKHGDQVLGALGLASVGGRDFSQQGTFLETLAAQVATGLQNALLHQNLRSYAEDLERRVAERTSLLREANADLARAIERVQLADQAKSAFLAAMSHELRTPLNSVIGFTGVLLNGLAGRLLPQQEEPLRIVQRNGRHLLALINDVLDLSKIEAGEMKVAHARFDLAQVAREALESMAPGAAAKGLELLHDFGPGTVSVEGDARRVAQILLNLLSNAVKFTDHGTVSCRLSIGNEQVQVAVQDTGPGIPAQDLPRLFREFEQLSAGLARRSEGTGLGLALSRRLARLMDGDILVESRAGEGSTFTLILPRPADEGCA